MKDKKGFVLFNDVLDIIESLNMTQRGQLFTAILEFENYGTVPDFPDDALLQALTKVVLAGLMRNDAEYAKKCKKKEFEGAVGGLVKSMRNGMRLSKESKKFLYHNGMLTREYLLKKEVPEKFLHLYLTDEFEESTQEDSHIPDWSDPEDEYEKLPFS